MAIMNPEDHVCPKCGAENCDERNPFGCVYRQIAQRDEQIAAQKAETVEAWRVHAEVVAALKADLEEQCRLLGISGSKEAKLLTEIAALKAAKARAGEAWRRRHPDVGMGWVPDPIEVLNAYFAEEAEHE